MPQQEDPFFIIDGAPVSETLWRWFFRHSLTFDPAVFESSAESTPGRLAIPEPLCELTASHEELPVNADAVTNLYALTAHRFLCFLHTFMTLCIGRDKSRCLDMHKIPPRDLVEFAQGPLKQTLLYWCLSEGHDDAYALHGLDPSMVCAERKCTNRNYHMRAYYLFQEITDRLRVLDASVPLRTHISGETQPVRDSRGYRKPCTLDFLKERIRVAYTGDLDGFIIDTIGFIQFACMSQNHEKVAQSIKYEKLHIAEFTKNSMTPFDTWRFIYPGYFDHVEDYFELFFEKFSAECIMYFFKDYLRDDLGIQWFPLYGMFYETRQQQWNSDLTKLLSCAEIERIIYQKYGKR